jgi:hypothetical protein
MQKRSRLFALLLLAAASGSAGSPAQTGGNQNAVPAAAPLTLGASRTFLEFAAIAGGSNPPAQTLNITPSGIGTLNWTATTTQPWLSVSPASGSGAASLSVGANINGLPDGSYSNTITITAPGASGSPRQIPVVLSVAPSSTSGGHQFHVTLDAAPGSTGSGRQYYVSPLGSARGTGSIDNPWNIATGFASPVVQPGDTIWVRGGTYATGSALHVRLVGTVNQPIVIRNYRGERAVIEDWLQVGCCDRNPQLGMGANVWIWGLEFWDPVTNRGAPTNGAHGTQPSIDTWAVGTKLINNIIHDTSGGPGVWKEAHDAEVYGNLMYFNGWQAPDRPHGHGLYTQNQVGTMLVSDNVSFDNFEEGMQFYGSGKNGYVRNYNVAGNVLFENGRISGSLNQSFLFAGGVGGVNGIKVTDNYTYDPANVSAGYTAFGFPWDTHNGSIAISGNIFADGLDATDFWHWTSIVFQNNQVYSPSNEMLMVTGYPADYSGYSIDNNTYWGGGHFLVGQGGPDINTTALSFPAWQSTSGLDAHSTYHSAAPTGVWTYVRPNKYEAGRANIIIYNWSLEKTVNVDVSGVLASGASYQIKDAEDFFGKPVASGVYHGGTVAIPMTGLTIERPQGNVPVIPTHTAPQFGVFVLLAQ